MQFYSQLWALMYLIEVFLPMPALQPWDIAALLLKKSSAGDLFSTQQHSLAFQFFTLVSRGRNLPPSCMSLCVKTTSSGLLNLKSSVRHRYLLWVSLPFLLPELTKLDLDDENIKRLEERSASHKCKISIKGSPYKQRVQAIQA